MPSQSLEEVAAGSSINPTHHPIYVLYSLNLNKCEQHAAHNVEKSTTEASVPHVQRMHPNQDSVVWVW